MYRCEGVGGRTSRERMRQLWWERRYWVSLSIRRDQGPRGRQDWDCRRIEPFKGGHLVAVDVPIFRYCSFRGHCCCLNVLLAGIVLNRHEICRKRERKWSREYFQILFLIFHAVDKWGLRLKCSAHYWHQCERCVSVILLRKWKLNQVDRTQKYAEELRAREVM